MLQCSSKMHCMVFLKIFFAKCRSAFKGGRAVYFTTDCVTWVLQFCDRKSLFNLTKSLVTINRSRVYYTSKVLHSARQSVLHSWNYYQHWHTERYLFPTTYSPHETLPTNKKGGKLMITPLPHLQILYDINILSCPTNSVGVKYLTDWILLFLK